MRLHGITELIDAFDGSVSSGIKADTVIGAADIVIDGGWNTYHIDTVLGQRQGAPEGTVATDGDNAV